MTTWRGYATRDGGAIIHVTAGMPKEGDRCEVMRFIPASDDGNVHGRNTRLSAGVGSRPGSFALDRIAEIRDVSCTSVMEGNVLTPAWKVRLLPALRLVGA